jgi:hypothetical protein
MCHAFPSLNPSVADPHLFEADPDPDSACHFDADPSFQIKAQNLEKCSNDKKAHIPFSFACRLQIDAYANPDHYVADPDAEPDPIFQFCEDPCGSGSTTLLNPLPHRICCILCVT